EVLPAVFSGHLSDFEFERRHRGGQQRWDVVAFNHSTDPFWSMIRANHRTTEVIFELKNVAELQVRDVLQVGHYLAHPFPRLGVLVTRGPIPRAIERKAQMLWERLRQVVLFLDDEQLIAMADSRARGGAPIEYLKRAYLTVTRSG